MKPNRDIAFALALAAVCLCWGLGCKSYVTPGRGVSMASLVGVDEDIQERMTREPASPFPARLAVVRAQGEGYRSHRSDGYGHGAYSVVTTRDIERDEHVDQLAKLPMVSDVVALNRLVIPAELESDKDLRLAAASVKADMLLVYSIDSVFRVHDHTLGYGQVLTLGLLPSEEAKVTATVSAALFDVRTGYVYGLMETTAEKRQLANAWIASDVVDEARQRAETAAFEQLLGDFEVTWKRVVEEYGASDGRAATASIVR